MELHVILADLPNRFDLSEWSCVNVEARKTNVMLRELWGKYNQVTLVKASKDNKYLHTHHGLHLNY